MFRFSRFVLAAALTLAAALPASAASVTLGKPGYGGPGCPGGSAAVTLSNGGKALNLRFTEYRVRAGTDGRSFDRASCNLTIPVKVPAGKALFVVGFEYKGYNRLPAGAKSTFAVEYFFPGTTGPKIEREFSGPRSGPFTINQALTGASVVKSACGASVNLRVNTSLRVTAGKTQASASIRNADVNTAMIYRLELRDC